MFDVEPLHTLQGLRRLWLTDQRLKLLPNRSFFTVRYPVIMQTFSHPNPKPTFAYKLRSYLTKTIDSLS